MASTLIRLLPRRKFDGTNVGSNPVLITVAEHIFIAPGTDVEIVARLHRNNLGAGSTLTIALVQDLYDSQDPGNIYINGSLVLAQTQFINNSVVPSAVGLAVAQTNLATRYAALQVTLARAASTCDADISVDLNIRSYEKFTFPANSYLGYRYGE